jgi:hypothetical protein
LEPCFKESSSRVPIVLMYIEEPETIRKYFYNFAKAKSIVSYSAIDVNSLSQLEEKQIKRHLIRSMEEVYFYLIHNLIEK